MSVYCRDCDNVHPETAKWEPWRWRCLAYPTEPGYGFVDPDYSPSPPYSLCRFANTDGECSKFTPIRKPKGE